MIRWAIILFLSIILGCSTAPPTKKEIKQTKVEVTVVQHKVPAWTSISKLESELKDAKVPDYILLTTMKCNTCRYLHKIMEEMGWEDKVLFLNVEEVWVKKLIEGVNIRVIPTLVVTLDGGSQKTVAFSGLEAITTALFEEFNVRK